ncbi:hypothetical protein MRY87_10215 [bacterium]|nr:hypothetical protein [bacterium]
MSIVRDGDFYLPEFRELIRHKKRYGIQRVTKKRRPVNLFPYGTSLLILPIVATVEWVPQTLPYLLWNTAEALPEGKEPDLLDVRLRAERALGALCTTGALLFLFFIGCEFLSVSSSALLVLAFAFGTPAWSTASRGLWQHGPVMLLFSSALFLFLKGTVFRGLAGLPLAFGYLVRPTTLLVWGWGGLLVSALRGAKSRWWRISWGSLLIYLLCSLLVALLFLSLNESIYHAPLNKKYYQPGRLAYHPDFWQALCASLLSPNRGLLFQSPFLFLSFCSIPLALSSSVARDERILLLFCWGSIVSHLVATSLFPNWWHGHCFGSRYMTDILPFFFVLLCSVFSRMRSKLLLGVMMLTVLIALPIHYRGAHARSVFGWNTTPVNVDHAPERVWSLRDWQVLR